MNKEELAIIEEEILAIMSLTKLLKDASETNDSPGVYHAADVINKKAINYK